MQKTIVVKKCAHCGEAFVYTPGINNPFTGSVIYCSIKCRNENITHLLSESREIENWGWGDT